VGVLYGFIGVVDIMESRVEYAQRLWLYGVVSYYGIGRLGDRKVHFCELVGVRFFQFVAQLAGQNMNFHSTVCQYNNLDLE